MKCSNCKKKKKSSLFFRSRNYPVPDMPMKKKRKKNTWRNAARLLEIFGTIQILFLHGSPAVARVFFTCHLRIALDSIHTLLFRRFPNLIDG